MLVNHFFQLQTSGIEDYLLVKRTLGDWVKLTAQHLELRGEQLQIAFQTSGSTGPPKTVVHCIGALRAEMEALHTCALKGLGRETRIIALVPPHHIYGFLFTCLLPSMTAATTIRLHRQSPLRSFEIARAGDVVIATSYIWDKLAVSGMRFASGVIGVTSGSPSSSTTWSNLGEAGLSDLIEVYGATETGGVGFRNAPDQSFQLLGHLERDCNTIRYRGNSQSPLDIQDKLNWTCQSSFEVIGRLDGAVQIAGVNVSPSHVAETIRQTDGVSAADVRFDGSQLRAYVVLEDTDCDAVVIQERVRRQTVQHLAPPARPAEFTFGSTLPRSQTGKPLDWV